LPITTESLKHIQPIEVLIQNDVSIHWFE